jgi:hypothetical protein
MNVLVVIRIEMVEKVIVTIVGLLIILLVQNIGITINLRDEMKHLVLKNGMKFSVHPECLPRIENNIIEIQTPENSTYVFPLSEVAYYYSGI